jgi:hypothetical protein
MKTTERTTVTLGVLAGLLALVLFSLAIMTQGSQGLFQINRPAADFSALLVTRAASLRADLGIDFIFLCVYAAFFLSLSVVLKAWIRDTPTSAETAVLINTATAALLITALLDAVENAHLLAMLSMAEQGQPISQGEIAGQMIESMVKFVFSYFGLFVLSFALPQDTPIEKLVVLSLRWVQLPVGVGIFVLPPEYARPLYICRAVFFFAGLWATAWIVWQRSKRSG